MTVITTQSRVTYNGDGVTTNFPIPFMFLLNTDISAFVTTSAGGVTQEVYGTNFTLSGAGLPTGGTYLRLAALPVGSSLQVYQNPPLTQATNYQQNSPFPGQTVTGDFDRQTIMSQRLSDILTRSIRAPDADQSPIMLLPPAAARANTFPAFDVNGNLSVAQTLPSGTLSQATIGLFLYGGQTAAEAAAGVVPANTSFAQGDVRRYGAVLDGVTDDTAALNNWVAVGGSLSFPGGKSAFITSTINLSSNSRITGGRGSTITTATHDISLFAANGKSDISVSGLTFVQTSVGTASGIGGILYAGCTYCSVEACEFIGMQFKGVFILASNNCTVRNNYFHNAGSATDSTCDIGVESSPTTAASFNVIDGNYCFGGAEFGIACWDPYSGVLPVKNIICNNRVGGGNSGYGILVYMPDVGDSFTQVIGNYVENVTGIIPTNVSSGAGIYVVGAGSSGTQIIGNTVRNCCINTANATLAPAGIGISGTPAGAVPIVVSGNTIEGMTQYYGILLTGVSAGASVVGNTVRHPATNTTGDAIRITNCMNVSVNDNTITLLTNGTASSISGILFAALGGATSTNLQAIGNSVTGGHGPQIRVLQTGGGVNTGLVISGNTLTGGDASAICLGFEATAASNGMVSNNILRAGGTYAISQSSALNMRYSTNFVNTVGSVTLSFVGTNTGSYYDKTNTGSGNGAGVSNAGTGLIIEQFGTAASPAAGTWAVGDRIEQSVPVVGNPKGWRCTVAGTPGTWVSEGNL